MSNKKKKKKERKDTFHRANHHPPFPSNLSFLSPSIPPIISDHLCTPLFSLSLSSFPPPSSFFFLVENIGRAIEAS